MNQTKWKKHKLGVVLDGKYGKIAILGNQKNKDPKYNYTVKLAVFDAQGKKVAQFDNPIIKMKTPTLPEGVKSKVEFELSISVQDETN